MEDKEKEINVDDEVVSKEEKGNKILKYFLLVILVAVVCGGIFGLGYKFFGENDDQAEGSANVKDELEQEDSAADDETDDGTVENDDQVVEEDIELEKLTKDSAVVKKLFEVFREDKSCAHNYYWDATTESVAKKFFAYKALDASAFVEVKCGDLEDSYLEGLYCAMNDASMKYYGVNEAKYEDAIKNETTKSVSAVVLEAKYKELFGKDAVMINEDFAINEGPQAHYDKKNNIYAEFSCECGGDCVGRTHTLDSITQTGTTLILNTTTVSNADSSDKNLITYTFKYEKETGNYIFVSRVSK